MKKILIIIAITLVYLIAPYYVGVFIVANKVFGDMSTVNYPGEYWFLGLYMELFASLILYTIYLLIGEFLDV